MECVDGDDWRQRSLGVLVKVGVGRSEAADRGDEIRCDDKAKNIECEGAGALRGRIRVYRRKREAAGLFTDVEARLWPRNGRRRKRRG